MNRRTADKDDVNPVSTPFKVVRPECERRTDRRLLCSNLVQISWSTANGYRQTETGVLENVSKSGFGLCIYTSMPLEPRSELSISLNRKAFTGLVVQCILRENCYLVGIKLNERCDWNAGVAPEHLIDVSLLDLG